MRLTTTIGHLGVHRLHHKGRRNSVVFLEAPRPDHHHDARHGGQERWRAASYRDPWPDRA